MSLSSGTKVDVAPFEREANTLVSLNHPHIAHIHGLEEANGGTPERVTPMDTATGETGRVHPRHSHDDDRR
jgi:hypothetical protein